MPCRIRILISSPVAWPCRRACAWALAVEMAISPPPAAGNESTSVALSWPRNLRFSCCISASVASRMQTSPRTPAARCACRAKRRSADSGARPLTFVLAVTAVLSIKQKRAATRPLENCRLLVLEQGRFALFCAGAGLLIQRQRHLLLARLVLFVSVDHALHQLVPPHLAMIEVHERNPIHVAQNIRGFH